MGNVLVELEKSNSTTELTKSCLQKVFKLCNIESRFRFLNQINNDDLIWCDSYLAVRPNSPMSYSLAKAVKDSGRFYAVMFDDDLLNRDGVIKWRLISTKKCIKLADLVISPNPILAKEYSLLTNSNRYVIFNTPVSNEEYKPTHKINDKVNFVYAAGRDHEIYFEKFIKPILNEFLSKYYSKVHFTFIGVEPDISGIEYKECFTFIPLMSLNDYNKFMRINNFDVGLAPLDDTRFSNRKYFNKYIEYTKCGIAGIYSNCLPYTLIVRNLENGILVNNTPKDWLSMLELAVTNTKLIEKCAINAQNNLKRDFTVESSANVIKKLIPELIVNKNDNDIHCKVSCIKTSLFYFMDKMSKFKYQIRYKGIKSTIKFTRNYVYDRMCKKK